MSSAHAAQLQGPGLNPIAPNRIVRFGMFTFLASEVMLFGGLIMAYVVLRVSQGAAYKPPGAIDLPLLQTGIATIVLVSSSFTAHWAEVRVRKGKRASWQLFLTIILGTAFLLNQAYEWNHLYHEHMWFNTNGTYGSTFFVLTGFHGFHVFVGILLLIFTWLLSMAGKFDGSNHNFLECTSLYWHFVDIVWIVVFFILYVI